MTFKLTLFSIILFITTLLNIYSTITSWRRRQTRIGMLFFFAMASITLWTLAAAFDYAAVADNLKIFFTQVEYIGYNSAIALFAVIALIFAGRERLLEKRWVKATFILLPMGNILLALTDPLHGWVWSGFRRNPYSDNVLIYDHGPGFTWIALTGYLMVGIIVFNLWQASHRASELTRRQTRLLLPSIFLPILFNLIYLLGIPQLEGIDFSSVAFSITGMILLVALHGTRLLDLAPIARETLIEQMADCVLVLDDKDRIVDFNQAAQDILTFKRKNLGSPIQTAFPLLTPKLNLDFPEPSNSPALEILANGQEMIFDIHITPLADKQKRIYGKLVVFQDITKSRQAEMALKKRIMEIEELHQNLQQAQKQLIAQQRELATIEAQQLVARNLHDSVSQSIHSLVLFSETLEAMIEKNNFERARQITPNITESARQTHKEIRLLLYGLMEPGLQGELDLIGKLEERMQRVENHTGVKGQVILEGSLENCPVKWQENLYWMALEALNNSLKHSRARSVQVAIRCFPQSVELEVRDNGKGFDPQKIRGAGLGLANMRARAQQLGGALTIESALNKGTRVRFYAERRLEQR